MVPGGKSPSHMGHQLMHELWAEEAQAEQADHVGPSTENLSGAAPFIYGGVDMFGSFTVKGLARVKRRIKVWGVMFSCLAIKAVAIRTCPGYNTETFGLTYRRLWGIYGQPSKFYTDHGPQIQAQAEQEQLHLSRVAEDTGWKGTE